MYNVYSMLTLYMFMYTSTTRTWYLCFPQSHVDKQHAHMLHTKTSCCDQDLSPTACTIHHRQWPLVDALEIPSIPLAIEGAIPIILYFSFSANYIASYSVEVAIDWLPIPVQLHSVSVFERGIPYTWFIIICTTFSTLETVRSTLCIWFVILMIIKYIYIYIHVYTSFLTYQPSNAAYPESIVRALYKLYTVEPLYNGHHWDQRYFVLYSKVSLAQE